MRNLIRFLIHGVRFSFGGGGGDGGAAEMRRQEEERQARVREGVNAINRIFGGPVTETYFEPVTKTYPADPGRGVATPERTVTRQVKRTRTTDIPSQFDDEFFGKAEKDYLDYYIPQFERQAREARHGNLISLARSGNIGGSVGAERTGGLAEEIEERRRQLIEDAMRYRTGLQTDLEQTRASLLGQAEAGYGQESLAGAAAAKAKALTAPPAFSPLADLFTNYTAALANATIASSDPERFPGADQQRRQLLFNIPSAGSSGSGRVVT